MDFKHEKSRIVLFGEDGKALAEVVFPSINSGTVKIEHTFVDDSLRGRGIAGELMKELVLELRESNRKAKPVCSYAVSWFAQHPECSDRLAD